jgi:hypothetical protein
MDMGAFGYNGGVVDAAVVPQAIAAGQEHAARMQEHQLKIQELARSQQMAQQEQQVTASSLAANKDKSTIEQLAIAGKAALDSGHVDLAIKLQNAATKAQGAQFSNSLKAAQGEAALAKADQSKLTVWRSKVASVNSQEQLDALNADYTRTMGGKSPLEGQQYSPKLISAVNDHLLEAAGKITTAQRERGMARVAQSASSAQTYRAFQMEMAQKHQDLAERREARISKVGGAYVGSPSKDERKDARKVVDQLTHLSSDDKALYADDIAARAKALAKNNKGMDYQTALDRAFQESSKRHDLVDQNTFLGIGKYLGQASQTYTQHGASAAQPIDASAEIPEEADLQVGKYYQLPDGGTYQWMQGGWQPVDEEPAPETETEEPVQ